MPARQRFNNARSRTPAASQSSAPATEAPAQSNSLLAQLASEQAPASEPSFLGGVEQAPPTPGRVEEPEHQEAVEEAVETALPQLAEEGPQASAPETAAPATEGPATEQAPAVAPPAPEQLPATMPGGSGSRPLTEAEIAYARKIYGDSIDYSKVRVTSDHWLSTGAPKTLGNTMHMRSEWGGANFDENGQLTDSGRELLMHEIGHVWQYQNGGAAYIGDSLWSQLKGFLGGGSRNEAYDWRDAIAKGTAWEDFNPEQQAEAIETYHEILEAEEGGYASSADLADKERLQPYIDKVRNGEGAPQFSTPGAVGGGLGGAAVGAGIGALVGGPIGALIGGGIGALVGGLFGGG